MAEAFDVADRGRFYDKTGAIRDVVQNHMLQVLATVLADPPDGSGLAAWRDAKQTVVSALQPADAGEHGARPVRGLPPGRRRRPALDAWRPTSRVRLTADSWRWAGVPILIRAGKCMPVTATEISIPLKPPPHDVFGIEPVRPAGQAAVPDLARDAGSA